LLDSFLRDGINKRKDKYGGSIQNRVRYPLEVLDVIIEVFGKQKVGVKLSPINDYNHNSDSDPLNLISYLIDRLNERQVAFLELSEGGSIGM
jgi:N-ethylmaleimide reductase